MSRGLIFNRIDASDEDESREDFATVETGLRELFASEIAPLVVAQYGENDIIALDTCFNDWTDGLRKDGQISDYVYENITRED